MSKYCILNTRLKQDARRLNGELSAASCCQLSTSHFQWMVGGRYDS
ncbi:MAG: hypothetical protein RLZ92_753 [Pseudomonadota bacterium]|jgi:hypothetical protein